MLALDEYLPPEFAHRGSRLVYSSGIVVLSVLAAALLIAFHGVTDRLIPLFAVGAFGAFTRSQHRATFLKGLILMKGGPQFFVINNPWYVEKDAELPEPEGEKIPIKVADAQAVENKPA